MAKMFTGKAKVKLKKKVKEKIQESISTYRKNTISITPRPRVHIQLKRQNRVNKHQENITTILQYSNATPIRCKGSIGYACCYCKKEFPEAKELKLHTLDDHAERNTHFTDAFTMHNFSVKLDITSLQCNLCGTNLNLVEDLVKHLSSIHNKQFHTKLKNYILPFKFDSDILKCVECNKEFNNFKILLAHMNSHYKNSVCDVCGSGFINKKIMQSHWRRHKKGVFNCSRCDKVFDTQIKHNEHEKTVHLNRNKRYKCGYCGEKFSDYTKKNDHVVKTHGGKPIVLNCQACDKTFDNQRALTVHMKTYHLLEGRVKKWSS